VIVGFKHRGLEAFFLTGSKAGIVASQAPKLGAILRRLNEAAAPQDLNLPGWGLHRLKGSLKGHWSVWVNASWRVTFRFVGADVELVDYQDYH
jgi:proteic killer suppression protein